MHDLVQLKQAFETNGYVALNNLLSPKEVEAARAAIRDCVAQTASCPGRRLGGNGKAVSLHSASSDFFLQLEPGVDPEHEPPETLELKVRKLMNFDREHPAFEGIAHGHARLQPVLETLLGPDPVLFQSMALIKPPHIGTEKPWHQDNAYFSVTPLDAVLGVWIALDAATVANGCMHVIPGGHRLGAMRHHHDKDCEILEGRLDPSKAVAVELPPGGALIFYGMLPHQTPPNQSPDRRRALQFHYHAAHATRLPSAEYDRVYAEADGTPASCAAARAQNR